MINFNLCKIKKMNSTKFVICVKLYSITFCNYLVVDTLFVLTKKIYMYIL